MKVFDKQRLYHFRKQPCTSGKPAHPARASAHPTRAMKKDTGIFVEKYRGRKNGKFSEKHRKRAREWGKRGEGFLHGNVQRFEKKSRKVFQTGQKLSGLSFRLTPRKAKGGEIGYDGKRTQECDTRSS